MLDKTRLRLAMQKSGRLSEGSQELLAHCGIKINLQQQRLIAFAENMPIDILRVRDDDIPGLVMDSAVDLGIIGETCWKKSCSIAVPRAKIHAISPCAAWTSALAVCRLLPARQ